MCNAVVTKSVPEEHFNKGVLLVEYKIYVTVCDIIDYLYEENKDRYKKLFIKIIPKEMKSFHGIYYLNKSLIEIFNLSRPFNHIIATILHEVAHHIDFCNRKKTDHGKTFYNELYKLLIAAMELNIISKEDIITRTDSKDKYRLEKYFGDIQDWQVESFEYKKNKKIIKVKNSYSIKEQLKDKGYKYSKVEQLWIKEIELENIEAEIEYLKTITDESNIKIIDRENLEIEAIYYIAVFNSFDYKELLKTNGYIYNGYGISKKSWNKKIKASELEKEEQLIKKLDGVKYKVISKK